MKLTRESFEKANRKLERLEKELTELIVKKKEALYQGEGWHDNAEFDMFKQDQMVLEEQIGNLRETLRNAEVLEQTDAGQEVNIGSTVVVSIAGEERKYILVDPIEANPAEHKISYASPLGAALMGARPNEKRRYRLGSDEKEITVISIK